MTQNLASDGQVFYRKFNRYRGDPAPGLCYHESMDYALIAGFEPTGDWMVRHWMRRLAEHGVNDLYESFGFAPHITLSEFTVDDFAKVESRIISLANSSREIEIRFSSLGIFPGQQGVLHLVPAASKELMALHQTVHLTLSPVCQAFSPLYLEPEWTPHCTLVLEMDPLELPRAYDALIDTFHPFTTRLTSLEVITCCPFQTILNHPLQRAD